MRSYPRFLVISSLCCIIVFTQQAAAQKKKPDPSIEHLYEYDYHAIDDKIYREHIPLDGDSVQMIPFREGKLYGFVDKKTKKMIIKPQFEQVYAVYKEGAIVKIDDDKKFYHGYGLVGNDGKYIIYPSFRNLFKEGDIYHGIFSTIDTTMDDAHDSFLANYYVDKKGNLLFYAPAHYFATFHDNDSLAWFRYGTKYSIYSRKGKLCKEFSWNKDKHFIGIFNNILVTATGEEAPYRYVGKDINDKIVFELDYDQRATAVVQMSKDVFGFFNDDGFYFTNSKGVDYPYAVRNGWGGFGFDKLFSYFDQMSLIPVSSNGEDQLMGYAGRSGKLAIPCKYKYAGNFINGEALVMENGAHEMYFINENGMATTQPVIALESIREIDQMYAETTFSEGLCRIMMPVITIGTNGASIYQSTKEGEPLMKPVYIDRSGKRVLELSDTIRYAGNFHDGRAVVVSESGLLGFIDTDGKPVVPLKYELAVAGAYPFPYIVFPEFKNGYAYLKAFKGYVDMNGYEFFSGKQEKDHYDFSH